MVLELFLVLEVLDDQEHEAERHREKNPDDCRPLFAGLRGTNRERHRQAAADEHGGVERAEDDVQLAAGLGPCHRVPDAVERVGEEQSAEEQHFGDEEQPHARALPPRAAGPANRSDAGDRGDERRASRVRRRARRWRQTTLISRCEYSYASSVTTGCVAKLCGSGGDCVVHSRPVACHGLSPASSP